MRGIQIGDNHTAEDWGLILNAMSVDPPAPKIVSVTVDGRDGDIDLSEAITGEVKYNNREASFTFLITEGTQAEREAKINEIINQVHGLNLNLILPDDPDHYLVGRCSIDGIKNNLAYGAFNLSANCEPYRYSTALVTRTVNATSTPVEIALLNTGRKTLTPNIVVNGSITVAYGDNAVVLDTGEYKVATLQLKTGTTTVRVSGSGTIVFSYREAVL